MSKPSFKLTVLGSGTMVPTKDRGPAGFFVEADGQNFLLDAGHGTVRQLVGLGWDFQTIKAVFISHFHTDHFADAFPLVHTRFVDDLYRAKDHQKLVFVGPQGIKKRFSQWRRIFWLEPSESYPVEFLEGSQRVRFGQVELETFPVRHVDWFPSVGLVMKFNGKKLVYTGDIGSKHDFQSLVKVVAGADLLITEASYEIPTQTHYSIGQIKELAVEGKVKKVLVVHVRPQQVDQVEKFCSSGKTFVLGHDGLKIKI